MCRKRAIDCHQEQIGNIADIYCGCGKNKICREHYRQEDAARAPCRFAQQTRAILYDTQHEQQIRDARDHAAVRQNCRVLIFQTAERIAPVYARKLSGGRLFLYQTGTVSQKPMLLKNLEQSACDGNAPQDIAVLYRFNAQVKRRAQIRAYSGQEQRDQHKTCAYHHHCKQTLPRAAYAQPEPNRSCCCQRCHSGARAAQHNKENRHRDACRLPPTRVRGRAKCIERDTQNYHPIQTGVHRLGNQTADAPAQTETIAVIAIHVRIEHLFVHGIQAHAYGLLRVKFIHARDGDQCRAD